MGTVAPTFLREGRIEPRTEGIVRMWAKASPNERAMIGNMQLHYEAEVQKVVDEGAEPQNIAHTIHALVDDSVRETLATHPQGRKVRCRSGCAGCCSLHVNITHEEAFLLVGWAEDQGIAIDWDKVRRQAPIGFKDWHKQPAHERRCVFLGAGGVCKVYEHRPVSCRKYLVVSDPKFCDTVRYPGHEVAILAPMVGEVIASAMLGVLESGGMARMLLEVKEGEQ